MDKKYLKDFMEKNYKSKSQFRTEIEVRKKNDVMLQCCK